MNINLPTPLPSDIQVSPTSYPLKVNGTSECLSFVTGDLLTVFHIGSLTQRFQRSFGRVPILAEVLAKTNIVALVFSSDPTTLLIWDDHQSVVIKELVSPFPIVNLHFVGPYLLLVNLQSSILYRIEDFQLINKEITGTNPHGLADLQVNQSSDYRLAVPSPEVGHVIIRQSESQMSFQAHQNPLCALALNSDGSLLATASERGTIIRIWSCKFRENLSANLSNLSANLSNLSTNSSNLSANVNSAPMSANSSNSSHSSSNLSNLSHSSSNLSNLSHSSSNLSNLSPNFPQKICEFRRGAEVTTIHSLVFHPNPAINLLAVTGKTKTTHLFTWQGSSGSSASSGSSSSFDGSASTDPVSGNVRPPYKPIKAKPTRPWWNQAWSVVRRDIPNYLTSQGSLIQISSPKNCLVIFHPEQPELVLISPSGQLIKYLYQLDPPETRQILALQLN